MFSLLYTSKVICQEGEGEGSSRKKHKKNKHKKKAKTRDDGRVVGAEPGVRPLTLKIKLGRKPSPATER